MKGKDQTNNPENKEYPEQEDFNRALATAITGDELRNYMYEVIDSWPWKEK
jgi:hypothetical protein